MDSLRVVFLLHIAPGVLLCCPHHSPCHIRSASGVQW
jgi:hypothetical protein